MFNLSASKINDIIYPQLLSLCEYYINHYRTFIKEYCFIFEKEEALKKALNPTSIKLHKISQNAQIKQLMNEYLKSKPDKNNNNFPPDCFTKLCWNIGSLDPFQYHWTKYFVNTFCHTFPHQMYHLHLYPGQIRHRQISRDNQVSENNNPEK